MEVREMSIEQLEERKAAIAVEVDSEGADLDALESEVRSIKEELERRAAEEAQKVEIRKAVAEGAGKPVENIIKVEEKPMTIEEIRSSAEYINAFADYIKTNDDKECRKLLSTNAGSGAAYVPVPVLVDDIIRHAWDDEPLLARVRKTNFRGNLKVAFESAADGAYVHSEGQTADTEESLTIGIVTMTPANIKKWITISDEAITMGGESFVRYIYNELAHQIVKKLAALVVNDIATASVSHSSSAVGVPAITAAPGVVTLANAAAYLCDEASNPCVIMNRLTETAFLAAYAAGNFGVDPFAGFTKIYSSQLPAYGTACDNAVYAIVGDLDGAQVNYPEGEGIAIKYDDLSLAEQDLVKIVGRQYAAHAVTAPGRFCNIKKPAAATT